MESTLSIILNLVSAQFKAEYDSLLAMREKLAMPITTEVRMVQAGGGGTMAEGVAKETAAVDSSMAGMATSVGKSTETVASDTKAHMSSAGSALSGFTGAGKTMESDVSKLMSNTRSNISNVAGPLSGMLPLAAAVGFGAVVYGATNTAFALKNFEEQAGVPLSVAKEWMGAASDFNVAPRQMSMTLKTLGQMLNSVDQSMGKSTATIQKDAAATEKVTVDKEALVIAQNKVIIAEAKLKDSIDKYGNSSTQAASADDALLSAREGVAKASDALRASEEKLSTSTTGIAGLTAKQSQAVQELGINLIGTNGKAISTTQLMMDLANAYTAATNGTLKNVTAQQASAAMTTILGGRAFALLPLLEQGSAALQDSLTKGAQANQQFNQSNVNALAQAKVNINNITDAVKNSLVNMAAGMTPAITWIDNNLGTIEKVAATIGTVYAMKKVWDFGDGLVKDLGQMISLGPKAISAIAGLFGGGSSSTTSGVGGVLSKVAGNNVIVQAFGPEAQAGLEAAGLGGGGTPVKTGENLIEGAVTGGLMDGLIAAAGVAIGAGTLLAVAGGVGYLVYKQFSGQVKPGNPNINPITGLPYSKSNSDAGKGTNPITGTKYSDTNGDVSNPMMGTNAFTQAAFKNIEVSAAQAKAGWSAIAAATLTSANGVVAWEANMTPDLQHMVGASGSTASALSDIETLVKAHKITSAATLAQYETDWNAVETHAKDTGSAQRELSVLIASGQINAKTQVPAFISAWNTLVNKGMSPSAIDGTAIKKQMDLTAEQAVAVKLGFTALANQANATAQSIADDIAAILAGGSASSSASSRKNQKTMASGGIISEPIYGIGQNTGTPYLLGESGNELVTPMNGAMGSLAQGSGSGGVVYIDMRGTQVFKTQDLDNLVNLLGPRIVSMLTRAGNQMQFKR